MTEPVRFHFDPACPWAWQGAQWIREVQRVRDIHVEWRLFSLFLINHPEEFDVAVSDKLTLALRTLVVARREGGNDAIGRLYEAIGERVHERQQELTRDLCRLALRDAA